MQSCHGINLLHALAMAVGFGCSSSPEVSRFLSHESLPWFEVASMATWRSSQSGWRGYHRRGFSGGVGDVS